MHQVFRLGFAVSSLVLVSAAADQQASSLSLSVRPDELVVVDGDTIDRPSANVRYRLYGLDAPEIGSAGCRAERAAGEAAKAVAERLIRGAHTIRIEPTGRMQPATERYRERQEAGLVLDGRDFNELMIIEGVARRDAPDDELWCDVLARCN